jgi:Na+-transporting NADH:ubiquinone oxidoreductase subunit NqrE
MLDELGVLADVARRLEGAGIDYMLTGSMALGFFAVPRMTHEI